MSKHQTKKQQALEMLRARKGQYRLISQQSGIDYSWLTKFAQGKIKDPGSDRVDHLLVWLTNTS